MTHTARGLALGDRFTRTMGRMGQVRTRWFEGGIPCGVNDVGPINRIEDVWGARTPYGRGEVWPERADRCLADGITPDQVDRWVQAASLLHSNGDTMDIAVKDDKIVGVRGRTVDRVNRGRLGPKDLYGWQANAAPD